MGGNAFGQAFRFTTWGESHGPSIGCVIDGVPPRLPLSEADIQPDLDRRKPGQSRFVTQRRESDTVRIVSGVFEGQTTGTPLALVIDNEDQRSKDYADIAAQFRPGHADYTYTAKYGIRDPRGGGRSSARETAMRVAAGAVARVVLRETLSPHIVIRGAVEQVGRLKVDPARWDWQQVNNNPFFCPDPDVLAEWEALLDATRKDGNSVGAILRVEATAVPAGLGEPVYDRLDADLAKAMMSINAVKGVEIGAGFASAALTGVENADEMRAGPDGRPVFLSNHAGGILGGISTGQDIIVRLAIKPTSSILTLRRSIDSLGQEIDITTKGRHDPCVGLRAVPVAEAMLALTLADHWLRHRGQVGGI